MKIKLIMPPRSFVEEAQGLISIPPLGIAHLASFLKKEGYEVELDDLDIKVISDQKLFNKLLDLQMKYNQDDLKNYLLNNVSNPYLDEVTNILLEKLEYKGYDIVGFSILESSAIDFALLLSKKIKEEIGCKIIFGGYCADSNLEKIYSFVDHVICGSAGEIPTLNIIHSLENRPLQKEVLSLSPKPMPDFSGLPFSCYRHIPEDSQFINPGKILLLPYIWSWGCPYRCSFCGNSLKNGKSKLILKPIFQITKELKELSHKYNTRHFFVLNEYVHVNREHTIDLCNELIKQDLNLLWCGCVRCNIDPKILPLLSKAGCFYATFGMESASDKILKKMKKGYDCKTAENAIKVANDEGMWVSLYIIVSFPHETEKDFNETFNFIQRNIDYIDQINVCSFYLHDSEILRNPDGFGIRIRKPTGMDKNVSRSIYAYDEINGYSWEEIKRLKEERLYKLYKLFYLYKGIPEGMLRASTYLLFYAFDKFKKKKEVTAFIKEMYRDRKDKEEFVLNITSLSNDNCLFYKKPKETIESFEEIKKKIIELKKRNIKRIIISGGEPTIHSSIFKIIQFIKNEGLDVKLNSNARMFSYELFCKKLYNVGLRVVSVPIFSDKPEIHDKVTKVTGSLNQTLQGINNWKKLGGDVEVRTVLFEGNRGDLSKFIDFILELETIPTF